MSTAGCCKVLHLITNVIVGGATDNTLVTVAGHDRSRFSVHLAAGLEEGEWLARAQNSADVFHPIGSLVRSPHPIRDLKALWELIRLFRQEQFDIVHTHTSKAGLLGRWAAKLAGVPIIVHTIHNNAVNDYMPVWERQFYLGLEKSVRPCTDWFITVCELNRQQNAQMGLLRWEQSQTIYSGIDFRTLDRPIDLQLQRRAFDVPEGWQTIVMVARLMPQKAPHLLISAFAQVLQHCPKTLLLLVGDGELRPTLTTQAQSLGVAQQVRFLGFRDDVPEILKLADVFALSSLWEGLGRSMTEAMLLGKPVVVPKIYGIPEIVHHNETGLLFPVGDVEQLATHLIDLLQHPEQRERLGQNAKRLTRELFDAKIMVQQIEQVYDQLCKSHLFQPK